MGEHEHTSTNATRSQPPEPVGGAKNGLLFGEAIVVLRHGASNGLTFLRKMKMQLACKMRFVSMLRGSMVEPGRGDRHRLHR